MKILATILVSVIILTNTLAQKTTVWLGAGIAQFPTSIIYNKSISYLYKILTDTTAERYQSELNSKTTYSISDVKSVQAGISFHKDLNPKFRFQYGLGIGFASYHIDDSNQFISSSIGLLIDTIAFNSSNIGGSGLKYLNKYINDNSDLNLKPGLDISTFEFQFPLLVEFQISPATSICAGVQLNPSILVSTTEDSYTTKLLSEIKNGEYIERTYEYVKVVRIDEKTEWIARMGISPMLQLNVYVWDKLQLSVGAMKNVNGLLHVETGSYSILSNTQNKQVHKFYPMQYFFKLGWEL